MSKDFENVGAEKRPPAGEDEDEDEGEFEFDQDAKLDLREEVFSQIGLLKAIRKHLFKSNGEPKRDTEFKDIRAYLSSSTQLLGMLQKFEEALKTDADFGKVELAMEKAMEDFPVEGFVERLRFYLKEIADETPE